MSSFVLDFSEEELTHIYLATCKALNNNSNHEAVVVFEGILNKLDPYVSDVTKMTGSIMKQL